MAQQSTMTLEEVIELTREMVASAKTEKTLRENRTNTRNRLFEWVEGNRDRETIKAVMRMCEDEEISGALIADIIFRVLSHEELMSIYAELVEEDKKS